MLIELHTVAQERTRSKRSILTELRSTLPDNCYYHTDETEKIILQRLYYVCTIFSISYDKGNILQPFLHINLGDLSYRQSEKKMAKIMLGLQIITFV